jgi:hypothetical protein
MGIGADIGGSIRMPAFFNGVYGHKVRPELNKMDCIIDIIISQLYFLLYLAFIDGYSK